MRKLSLSHQYDKAIVKIGVFVAKMQTAIVIHLEYNYVSRTTTSLTPTSITWSRQFTLFSISITKRSDVQPQSLGKDQWLCLLGVVNMTGVPPLSSRQSGEDSKGPNFKSSRTTFVERERLYCSDPILTKFSGSFHPIRVDPNFDQTPGCCTHLGFIARWLTTSLTMWTKDGPSFHATHYGHA